MENRDEQREKAREREWRPKHPVGGGPEEPGGDTEPSNWPGETRERGLRAPEAEPVIPSDTDVAGEPASSP